MRGILLQLTKSYCCKLQQKRDSSIAKVGCDAIVQNIEELKRRLPATREEGGDASTLLDHTKLAFALLVDENKYEDGKFPEGAKLLTSMGVEGADDLHHLSVASVHRLGLLLKEVPRNKLLSALLATAETSS